MFQSSRKGVFDDDYSRYLASRLFGKFKGKLLVKLDLMMVLTGVIKFLVVIMVLYP